jgi:hypothetical protein
MADPRPSSSTSCVAVARDGTITPMCLATVVATRWRVTVWNGTTAVTHRLVYTVEWTVTGMSCRGPGHGSRDCEHIAAIRETQARAKRGQA